MLKIAIMIPSFNRSELARSVLRQLRDEAVNRKLNVHVLLFDDSSDWRCHDYKKLRKESEAFPFFRVDLRRTESNRGRERHWKLWNEAMDVLVKWNFDLFYVLPDDHDLCDRFLERTMDRFEKLRKINPSIVAMNLLINYPKCWGTNRFVDGAFIATRGFFLGLNWALHGPPPELRKLWEAGMGLGSGVGRDMTVRIGEAKGICIADCSDNPVSWIKPMAVPSAMFPEDRFQNRVAKNLLSNFVDDGGS